MDITFVYDELDELDEIGIEDEKTTTQEIVQVEDPVKAEVQQANFANVDNTYEAIDMMSQAAVRKIASDCINDKKDINTGVKEAMAVASAFNAANDKDFQESLDGIKKEEIKSSFKASKYQADADKENAKHRKAEAFYKSFRPVLEFDFSNITGKERGNKKTYDERSYGLSLMVFMVGLLALPYGLTILFLSLLTMVNTICEHVALFSKPAIKICVGTATIGLIIENRFGIPLIHQPVAETALNLLRGRLW